MSWFWGHILPGTGWLIMALFHYLQSLNHIHFTKPLRTRPFWIVLRSLAVMGFCVAGIIGECIGEWNNWNTQQNQHLTIWAGFFLSGLIEYLHINNILHDNFWCVIPPIGMSFIGIMLMLHTQLREYWRYMHMFSGYITVPMVLCLVYMSISRLSRAQKANKGSKSRIRPATLSFRGKNLEDLNPIYTEQTVYDTVLPGFIAFLFCLQGIGWWEMAFRMGWYWAGDNLPPEVEHAEHAFLAQVIADIFVSCLILGFVSIVSKMIDSDGHKDDFDKEANML